MLTNSARKTSRRPRTALSRILTAKSFDFIAPSFNAPMSSTEIAVVLGDINSPAEEVGYQVLTRYCYAGVDINSNMDGGKAQAHM